jgi:type III secretion protein V
VIDMGEARTRRERITKESQLYGAMDGAMKFVKGDAIAGLIITVVNILGGVMIGVTQMGIPAGEAIQLFGVLSIGDALVSQIPALLIAITAGIVTTRVSTEESTNLGGEIATQIMAQPKALLLAGGLAALFALVPGFPKPQFLLLGAVVMAAGYGLTRMRAAAGEKDGGPAYARAMAPAGRPRAESSRPGTREEEFALTVPLLLDVAQDMETMIPPEVLDEELMALRRALYFDLGVPFPGIHLRFTDQLQAGAYTILLQEIPMSQGRLRHGWALVRERPEHLDLLGVPYETGEKFLPNLESIWVEQSRVGQLAAAGVSCLGPVQILTYHLSFVLKKNADEFIGLQETRYLLEKMDPSFPELVKEIQRVLPIQKLAEIFQRLVQEEISVRNLRVILQTLIEWGQKEKDTVLLTEYARAGLKRYISHRFSGGQNVLAAYLLNPDVEETIRKAIRQTSAGSYLALDPNTTRQFVAAVKQEVGDFSRQTQRPVLLTSMDIRRYTRKLIELDLYELPVLSYQELVQDVTIQPLGRITL